MFYPKHYRKHKSQFTTLDAKTKISFMVSHFNFNCEFDSIDTDGRHLIFSLAEGCILRSKHWESSI